MGCARVCQNRTGTADLSAVPVCCRNLVLLERTEVASGDERERQRCASASRGDGPLPTWSASGQLDYLRVRIVFVSIPLRKPAPDGVSGCEVWHRPEQAALGNEFLIRATSANSAAALRYERLSENARSCLSRIYTRNRSTPPWAANWGRNRLRKLWRQTCAYHYFANRNSFLFANSSMPALPSSRP